MSTRLWRFYVGYTDTRTFAGYSRGGLWLFGAISPVVSPPYGSYLLSPFFSRAMRITWHSFCVFVPPAPNVSMLAFREWTERVFIIIDTIWPSRQVRALRFENGLNVKRLRVGGKRFR